MSDKKLMVEKFQPKKTHRFIVEIDGLPSWAIKSIELPKFHDTITDGEVTMKLYDPLEPNISDMIIKLHDAGVDRDIVVKLVSSVGEPIEKWIYKDAKINYIDFGYLDWTKDDSIEITAKFKYNYAYKERI